MSDIPFNFDVPVEFFEKAGAPQGRRRRIGGVVSTETRDQQGEIVLQQGLDFGPFLKSGWFNDNHDSRTAKGLVGYPEAAKLFKKGQQLPSGRPAPANCHWVEGYLLDGWEPADDLWNLGMALKGTGRSLGYSIQGKIRRRTGPKTIFKKSGPNDPGKFVGDTVAKATVREVAVTRCPVNDETSLETLAKSIQAVGELDGDALEARVGELEKALGMGEPTIVTPEGPQSGMGAGHLVSHRTFDVEDTEEERKKRKQRIEGKEPLTIEPIYSTTYKSLTRAEAEQWVASRLPQLDDAGVDRFITIVAALKRQGRL